MGNNSLRAKKGNSGGDVMPVVGRPKKAPEYRKVQMSVSLSPWASVLLKLKAAREGKRVGALAGEIIEKGVCKK